ncbi:NAD(P)-dependent oxidoreductase [Streptosporangium canum]|uniref:NAD(P)-dependent oxidoreductase n=1 Tax=Streptosporangium canum TaxID=324952 RepID=UPI00367DD796
MSGPGVAMLEIRGESADLPVVLDAIVSAIGKIVDVHDDNGGTARERRLRLGGGGRARLSAGPPVDAKAAASGTFTVALVLEEPAALPPEQAKAVMRTLQRVPFTGLEMRALSEQMPLTAELPHFLPPGCLADVAPVLTVHHMTDFLTLVGAVQGLGVPPEAITVLDKGYRYRHTQRVDAHLTAQGITVWPWQRAAEALADHVQRAAALGRRGLLIDDGGYTLPVLLRERPDLIAAFCGLVEQTISGITRLEPWPKLPLPILSVAESRLKATIESYGIAEAAITNLRRLLPEEKLEGQPALVIGYGRIGEQIAAALSARRMQVAVYDHQLVQLIAAHERGYRTDRRLSRLLREHRPMLIIGSTGRTSLRGEHAAAIMRNCYLVSTTSRDREFAIAELEEDAVEVTDEGVLGTRLRLRSGVSVTLVGDGYPINFHHAESLPNSSADLILASLIVGAATLAAPGHDFMPGHNVAATNRALEGCGLLERYYARFGPGVAR